MSHQFTTAVPAKLLREVNKVITSHSIDGTFDSCPRRFEFMHLWKKSAQREASGFAADVGTALHEAVQEWTRYAISPIHKWTPEAAYEKGLFALAKWWPWVQEDYRKDNGLPVGQRTFGIAAMLYELIIDHPFWDEWELVHIDSFGPAIEVPWLIVHTSLGTIKTPYGEEAYVCTQGKIDWILRHKVDGRFKVFDLKTTVKEISAHTAAFKFSGQGPLYGIVLSHALGLDWKSDGLDMTYLLAYFGSDDAAMFVEPMNFTYKAKDIQDGIDVKLERLARMVHYAQRGSWPRRAHGCDFYGRACGFLDICESRNEEYIKHWFRFEVEQGTMQEHLREYAPVWVIQA